VFPRVGRGVPRGTDSGSGESWFELRGAIKPDNDLGHVGRSLSAGCVSYLRDLTPCASSSNVAARASRLHDSPEGVIIGLLVAVDERGMSFHPPAAATPLTGNALRSVAHSRRNACHMLPSGLAAPDNSYARLSQWAARCRAAAFGARHSALHPPA